MGSVNRVILIGHLGKDPEARSFDNGGRVVNFSMATSERWRNRDGEQQEKTEWHQVAIFNEKIGEVAEKYLRKGSQVYIEGKLQTRKWTDKDGNDRYTTEVVVPAFGGALTLLDNGGGRDDDRGDDREERRSRGRDEDRTRSNGREERGGRGGGWDGGRDGDRGRGRDGRSGRGRDDLSDDIPFNRPTDWDHFDLPV